MEKASLENFRSNSLLNSLISVASLIFTRATIENMILISINSPNIRFGANGFDNL